MTKNREVVPIQVAFPLQSDQDWLEEGTPCVNFPLGFSILCYVTQKGALQGTLEMMDSSLAHLPASV